MEDRLLDEFQSFCKFDCKYKEHKYIKNEIIDEQLVYNGWKSIEISPCNHCQIEEFIREIGSRL